MSEWWTYGLADFVMYAPRTYARLVESYNRALWPGPLLALAAGLVSLGLAHRSSNASGRVLALVLAAAWAWVAWAFHAQRYATIFLGGSYLATAFAVQALLLVLLALAPLTRRESPSTSTKAAGWTLALLGIAVCPVLAPVAGHPWSQAEVFGWMPDPTALATWGLLLASGLRLGKVPRWTTMVIPVLAVLFALLSGVAQKISAAM